MTALSWIAELLFRLVVVPLDLLLGRRKKAYSGEIFIHAPQRVVWDHLTAEVTRYDGALPIEVRQVRRHNDPKMFDASIAIGDEVIPMTLREIEDDGSSRLVTQVLEEGTDPRLCPGRDHFIISELASQGDGTRLRVTYAIEHTSIGGRFNLPLGLVGALSRIKKKLEHEHGTETPVANTPLRDGFLTAVLTLASFALLFDLGFAVLLLVVLLLHELGHVAAMRAIGMPVRGVYFIPFMGAVAVGQEGFGSEARRGFVALMGPAASMATSLAFLLLFQTTGEQLWRDLAVVSLLLNAFNLLPVLPLDGGQVLSALMSRAGAGARKAVQLALLGILGGIAWTFGAFFTLAFVAIVAFFIVTSRAQATALTPIDTRAGWSLAVGYLATIAFYAAATLWFGQLWNAAKAVAG